MSLTANQATKLGLRPGGVPLVLHTSQYDQGRMVTFTLYNGSDLYVIPEGVSGTIRCCRPNGTAYAEAVTVNCGASTVVASIGEQINIVAGRAICEIVLVDSGENRIGTANFYVEVEKAPIDDDAQITQESLAYAEQVLDELQSVAAYHVRLTQAETDIDSLESGLAAEASARQSADNTLQSNINSEASTRAAADTTLQSQIDQLVAPSGSAPSAAEVENARVGVDGTTYDTLGNAIRGQVGDLKSAISESLIGIREYQDRTSEFVIGKYITTGAVGAVINLSTEVNGAGATRTLSYCLFDVNEGDTVYFTGQSLSGSGTRCISMVRSDGTVLKTSLSETAFKQRKMIAPEDCKCLIVAVTWLNSEGNKKHTVTVISNDNFTQLENKVTEIDTQIGALKTTDGWYSLDASYYVNGSWKQQSTENRAYRIRTTGYVTFTRDVHLLALPGFYITVFTESSQLAEAKCCVDVPANTPIKAHIRRIVENASETADVAVFATKMVISSGLAGMEKYASTFTDVTMFPRMGISGDSYSAGGGVISGIRNLTWGKNLERESGVTVDIYAQSGEDITGWNTDAENGLPALLAGEECGLYWFAHGINGTSTDAAIGTPADMSADPKPQTFYGQYVYAIEAVKAAFPNARIVIATIMGTGYKLYQTTYANVNTAIRNIAEYCQIPVVDLADDDFYKSTWYDEHHLSNHPTAMLNAGIAHANRRILAKCIMDNPNYFINYGNRSS